MKRISVYLSTFAGLVAAALAATAPARAFSLNDGSDAYLSVSDESLKSGYTKALTSAGESSTGQFYSFNVMGCSPAAGKAGENRTQVYIHAVQDRGLPRGNEYPTYVFTTKSAASQPEFTFKTFAGRQLYLADVIVCQPDTCLLSAQQGYTDICLSDPFGAPGPELPGLRKDFWSDLIKLFGF